MIELLKAINNSVNREVEYALDIEVYGINDRWGLPIEFRGQLGDDCDGYSFLKRKRLMDLGQFDQMDVRLLMCLTYPGFRNKKRLDHMVLAVRRDEEWLILDNRSAFITPIQAADYHSRYWWWPEIEVDAEGNKRWLINGKWTRNEVIA